MKLTNYKERTRQISAILDKYIPVIAEMDTIMKKYKKRFENAESEIQSLKSENEALSGKLAEKHRQSVFKTLQDAQLQRDYAEAKAVLERIPPEIIREYAQHPIKTKEVDHHSTLE